MLNVEATRKITVLLTFLVQLGKICCKTKMNAAHRKLIMIIMDHAKKM